MLGDSPGIRNMSEHEALVHPAVAAAADAVLGQFTAVRFGDGKPSVAQILRLLAVGRHESHLVQRALQLDTTQASSPDDIAAAVLGDVTALRCEMLAAGCTEERVVELLDERKCPFAPFLNA
jgi:hypothetical protein